LTLAVIIAVIVVVVAFVKLLLLRLHVFGASVA
jgi:hypothetical protein